MKSELLNCISRNLIFKQMWHWSPNFASPGIGLPKWNLLNARYWPSQSQVQASPYGRIIDFVAMEIDGYYYIHYYWIHSLVSCRINCKTRNFSNLKIRYNLSETDLEQRCMVN